MRIFDNFLYKVVALLIAALLWAAAQGVQDVEQSMDLSVLIQDKPEDMLVVDQSTLDINVRLRGSRAALRQAKVDLTHYPVSLQGAKEGEWRHEVTVETLPWPRGAEIVARSPAKLLFQMERIESKSAPVRVDMSGELPEGYTLREIQVEPPRVPLAGARTSIRRVREVRTEGIDMSALRQTTTLERRVLLGVPNVWFEDDADHVRVTFIIESPPEDGEPSGDAETTQG